MRMNHFGPSAVIGLFMLVPLGALADDDQVDLKDVPASVREAALVVVPEAKWTDASKETDDDEISYRLTGADAKGREVHITLTSDGEVKTFETVLSVTDLPTNVVEVLRTSPEVKWCEATKKVEDGETSYEVSGRDLKDRESNAFFASDGKATIHSDRELSDVPGVVTDALKAKLPTFEPERVRSVVEDGKVVAYLFIKSNASDGDETEVTISADGKGRERRQR